MPIEIKTIKCHCGGKMILTEFYFGKHWECIECGDTHGAHQHSGRPLGKPADKATKKLRIQVHRIFDKLWEHGRFTRRDAYIYFARQMSMPVKKCHISLFDEKTCKRALEVLA